MILLDCDAGVLELQVSPEELAQRELARADLSGNEHGLGRELFGLFRRNAGLAERGGSPLFGND